jgi:hypothetical protein
MTEPKKGKYSALSELGIAKEPATQPEERAKKADETPPQQEAIPLNLPVKADKPQGKRSNPDWKQFSILLKKESQKKAVLILRERYEGVDISDLMEALLEQWLNSQ